MNLSFSAQLDDRMLDVSCSAEEVAHIKSGIKLDDRSTILRFGDGVQNDLSSDADAIRHAIASDDVDIAASLVSLLRIIKKLQPGRLKRPFLWQRLFFSEQRRLDAFRAKVRSANDQVEQTALELRSQQAKLKRDQVLLDQLYEQCHTRLQALEAHIAAGDQRIAEYRAIVLPKLDHEAQKTGHLNARVAAERYAEACQAAQQLARKIDDLKVARTTAAPTLPNIRQLQQARSVFIETLQTSLARTLPAWKSQMIIALALHQQKGTSALEGLDIDALVEVNQELLDALNDAVARQIQSKRDQADAQHDLLRTDCGLKRRAPLSPSKHTVRGIPPRRRRPTPERLASR